MKFFDESSSPKPPEKFAEIFASQGAPPVSKTPAANNGTISDCLHLKKNLKERIYLYVNSTTQRCSNKIIKFFWLKIFSICHLWTANISANFRKNLKRPCWNTQGLGETHSWKNLKSKISWHCPSKLLNITNCWRGWCTGRQGAPKFRVDLCSNGKY